MCKTVCFVQYTFFYLHVFHQCLNNSLIHFECNLIACLEIWKLYCRRMYESPVAQNRNVTASLSWNGTAARNLLSFFTIFGPTKFISISWCSSAIRVNFLYRPLISWHFQSANKPVPLYTDLFLYNSVFHLRLYRVFLLLGNTWCTNMKATLVKQCICHFIKPLVHIYNVSLQTGIFPDMMKKAKIKPLFKKGDIQDIKKL